MKIKYIILAILMFSLIVSAIILFHSKTSGGLAGKKYQGAVPEDYDLQHYRNTGETIKEVYLYYNLDNPNELLIKNDEGKLIKGELK